MNCVTDLAAVWRPGPQTPSAQPVNTGAITGGAQRRKPRLTTVRLPRASTASTRIVCLPARMLLAGTLILNCLLLVRLMVRPSTATTTRRSAEPSRIVTRALNAARVQPDAWTPPTATVGFLRSTRAAGAALIVVS